MRPHLGLLSLLLLFLLSACSRDTGLPDPAPQLLVPCHADGGADDPLACPPLPAPADGGSGD